MKKTRCFKGIAVAVMTMALFIQGQPAFAADIFDSGEQNIVATENNHSETPIIVTEPSTYNPPEIQTDDSAETPSMPSIDTPSDIPEEMPSDIPSEVPEDSIPEDSVDTPDNEGDEGQSEDGDVNGEGIFSDETGEQQGEEPGAEEPEEEITFCALDFVYEDSDVIITASASQEAELPEHAQMAVMRLTEGMPEYEEAKAASAASLGSKENAAYAFYDVNFIVDGQMVEPPKGTVSMKMEFKTIQMDSNTDIQRVVHIENVEGQKVVNDVTASAGDGEDMKSVDFAF